MKRSKSKQALIRFAALLLLSGGAISCKGGVIGPTIGTDGGSDDTSTLPPEALRGTVGIKNFLQLRASMSTVTGVPVSDPGVDDYFQRNKTHFSSDGRVGTISGPMMLAHSGLAGIFCSKLVDNESSAPSSSRKFFSAVDFTRNPTAFTDAIRRDAIRRTFQNILTRVPEEAEFTILLRAMNEASAGRPLTADLTSNLCLITCTAVLASIEFSAS
jgi:hypothetical protein